MSDNKSDWEKELKWLNEFRNFLLSNHADNSFVEDFTLFNRLYKDAIMEGTAKFKFGSEESWVRFEDFIMDKCTPSPSFLNNYYFYKKEYLKEAS